MQCARRSVGVVKEDAVRSITLPLLPGTGDQYLTILAFRSHILSTCLISSRLLKSVLGTLSHRIETP